MTICPVRVGVQGAIPRIDRGSVGRRHLKPAAPVDRQIERVAGVGERTLNVQAADRRGAHAQPELRAFGNGGVAPAVGHAHQPFRLIHQDR